MTPTDPFAQLRDEALRRVLEGPGESDPAMRQAAAVAWGARRPAGARRQDPPPRVQGDRRGHRAAQREVRRRSACSRSS